MGEYAFDREPDYIAHVARNDWAGAQTLAGVTEAWDMPVALFDVRGGFENRAEPGTISHHTLKWRVSGSAVSAISGRSVGRSDLVPGHGVCIQPRSSRASYWSAGDLQCAHLYWSDDRMRSLATELHEEDGDRPDLVCEDLLFSTDAVLASMTQAYFKRALSYDPPTALEMDTRCLALTSHILIRHSVMRGVRLKKRGEKLSPRQIARAIEILVAGSLACPRLADVAKEIGTTPFHFSRAFNASVGIPPHRWLLKVRLEQAKTLLRCSNAIVSDIAASVGYGDPSYFARIFKKYTGCSPLDFRKNV